MERFIRGVGAACDLPRIVARQRTPRELTPTEQRASATAAAVEKTRASAQIVPPTRKNAACFVPETDGVLCFPPLLTPPAQTSIWTLSVGRSTLDVAPLALAPTHRRHHDQRRFHRCRPPR